MPPAATVGHLHSCPKSVPDEHVGGPISGPGASTVKYGNAAAARASFGTSSCHKATPEDAKAATLVEENAALIIAAANEFNVDPKTLAGIIYVENWKNVNWTELLEKPLGFYKESIPLIDKHPSIGLSQVQIRTARMLEELGYIEPVVSGESGWIIPIFFREDIFISGTRNMAREKRLENNTFNTRYAAAYVRYLSDQWAAEFPSIQQRPDIIATLYNRGVGVPHGNPGPNDFGEFVLDNYDAMGPLLGLPCGEGDFASCRYGTDQIVLGSDTVSVEGLPAARVGDLCLHGGQIDEGCATIIIG